jgi:hypothetical protein
MGRWLRKGRRFIASVSHGTFGPLRRAMLIICCVLVAPQLPSLLMPQRVPTALAAPALEGPAADPSRAAVCG